MHVQAVGAVLDAGENELALKVEHVSQAFSFPAAEYVFTSQEVQTEAPSPENEPAAHGVQSPTTLAPVVERTVPAGHFCGRQTNRQSCVLEMLSLHHKMPTTPPHPHLQ